MPKALWRAHRPAGRTSTSIRKWRARSKKSSFPRVSKSKRASPCFGLTIRSKERRRSSRVHQAEAAAALLRELKAQPRKENLDVADAQVVAAEATLKTAQDTLQKDQAAYEIDPRSVSKDALDSALNAAAVAKANLIVAKKQDDLTKAGAWIYDIQNQDRQQHALAKAYAASRALLGKYTLRASRDGVVLAINTIVGNYVSPQGVL